MGLGFLVMVVGLGFWGKGFVVSIFRVELYVLGFWCLGFGVSVFG